MSKKIMSMGSKSSILLKRLYAFHAIISLNELFVFGSLIFSSNLLAKPPALNGRMNALKRPEFIKRICKNEKCVYLF